MYFLIGVNTEKCWYIPEEKYFAPLRILNLYIKSFINLFFDIALIFSDSSFNSFSRSTCFLLFEVKFSFTFYNLSSKSVSFYDISDITFAF